MMKTFTIRCHDRVLVVEDNPERIVWFREKLLRATLVRHPLLAIDALRARPFDVVFIDADLPCPQNFTGVDVAKFLVRSRFRGRVLLHSYNQRAVREMKRIVRDAVAWEFGDFEILNGGAQ
jgi:CheY-like chemotaxis protein